MFKIKEIQIHNIGLPLQQTIHMSKVTIEKSNSIIIKAISTNNEVGWGEAAASLSMTGESAIGMIKVLEYIRSDIIDREIKSFDDISTSVQTAIYGNYGAKSAMEVALIDLFAKTQKVSFSDIIGTELRSELPIIWRIAGSENEIEEAKQKRDEGFKAFKIKVGAKNIDDDLRRAEQLRKSLGDAVQLTADANAGYSREAALKFCSQVDHVGLDYMEQPVNGYDIETMGECKALMNTPLSADEGIHSLGDLAMHQEKKAADGASLKLIKFGGTTSLFNAVNYMNDNDMHVNISGKAGDSSISAATIGHISKVASKLDWFSNVSIQYLADDIIRNPMAIQDGKIILKSGLGLGIDVDEEKISQYAI